MESDPVEFRAFPAAGGMFTENSGGGDWCPLSLIAPSCETLEMTLVPMSRYL